MSALLLSIPARRTPVSFLPLRASTSLPAWIVREHRWAGTGIRRRLKTTFLEQTSTTRPLVCTAMQRRRQGGPPSILGLLTPLLPR
jgi:hypothetical protein